MKILIATGIYPPEIGGPATYSKLLENTLPSKGIDVFVLPYRLVKKAPKVFRHFWYFLKVIKHGRSVDVIYAQDPVSVGFPAGLAAKILGKKFILKIVGDYAWEQGRQRYGVEESLDDFVLKKNKYSFQVRIMRWVQKFVGTLAYKIVVPSKYLKKIVTSWGVDGNKIFVVYNAFEVVSIKEGKESLRKKTNMNSFTMLSVGRLTPWKGFKVLIESVIEIKKKVPDVKLVIVGSGTQGDELKYLVKKLNLEASVVFTGQLERKDVLEYIVASDVFVLNTQYEGFSHLVLEVMSLGTPIITTSVGGNVEIVQNNENGILVSFNNKDEIVEQIISIYNNPEVAKEKAEKGMITVEQFSTERMFDELIKVLRS